MNIIVAVSENWCIGNDDSLLEFIPEDMKFFKETTIDNVVIVGKKTFLTFPKKPLINRTNIVLTRDKSFECSDTVICNSIEILKNELLKYDTNKLFVIGGSSIYDQLLQYCDTAYVTIINTEKHGNKYFNNLNLLNNWELSEKSDIKQYKDLKYHFTVYKNKEVKNLWI